MASTSTTTGVVETHWSIAIETDIPGQLTSRCGCNWFSVIAGASARSVAQARREWDDHPCKGRPFPNNQERAVAA